MTGILPAIEPSDKGTILTLEVSPGGKVSSFPSGYNPWRKAIGCRVRSPATGGKANREVISIVAGFFDLSTNRISIISGATSPIKRVLITGMSPDAVLTVLSRSSEIGEDP
jgi:uncharacterized protein (TIGR00251 family)